MGLFPLLCGSASEGVCPVRCSQPLVWGSPPQLAVVDHPLAVVNTVKVLPSASSPTFSPLRQVKNWVPSV